MYNGKCVMDNARQQVKGVHDEPYDYAEEDLLDHRVQTYRYTTDGGLKESSLLHIQENMAGFCAV